MKNFSLLDTPLIMSSKSSKNHLLTSSLKPTCGTYTLMMFKTKSPKTDLIMMILSPCLLTATTSFLKLLSIKMPTPFLLRSFSVYYNLKSVFSTSLAFWHVHLVFWTHKIFTRLLIAVSTNSLSLPVKNTAFQLPKQILLSPTSFLAPRTRRV
jgi:hypothetical protein